MIDRATSATATAFTCTIRIRREELLAPDDRIAFLCSCRQVNVEVHHSWGLQLRVGYK